MQPTQCPRSLVRHSCVKELSLTEFKRGEEKLNICSHNSQKLHGILCKLARNHLQTLSVFHSHFMNTTLLSVH